MGDYLSQVNAGILYLIVGVVLAYITLMCVVFLVKSYRAGIKIGMDKKVLKKTILSSATFTLLPSISILLGVVALSGTLGVPFSWLRLSVIGALQYELNVAEIAAQSIGLPGLRLDMLNIEAFVTIALVMTIGILGGLFFTVFFGKGYLKKLQNKPKVAEEENGEKKKPGFGAHATTAMFVGLCATFIGAYAAELIRGFISPDVLAELQISADAPWMRFVVALIAAGAMAVFEFFIQKKGKAALENFSLAASMLVAMAGAVLIGLF